MLTFENGIDIRCRQVDKPQVAKFGMGDGSYRFILIGTDYGYVHTSGGDVRTWATADGARWYFRERYFDWRDVPAEFREKNPKLDLYNAHGRYVSSTNWYQNVAHARAHLDPARVARIVKA